MIIRIFARLRSSTGTSLGEGFFGESSRDCSPEASWAGGFSAKSLEVESSLLLGECD